MSRGRDITRRELLSGAVAMSVCAGLWLPRAALAATPPPPAVIIVSKKLDVESVSTAELRRCFLGREAELGGVRLVPFNHPPEHELRKLFDQKILGMSPVESQRYWINSMIRGGPRPPRKINDPKLLGKVVATLKGAVSYLDPELAETIPGLRILAIDGSAPSDKDYPLR